IKTANPAIMNKGDNVENASRKDRKCTWFPILVAKFINLFIYLFSEISMFFTPIILISFYNVNITPYFQHLMLLLFSTRYSSSLGPALNLLSRYFLDSHKQRHNAYAYLLVNLKYQ